MCIRTGLQDNTQGRRAAKKLRRLIHNQLQQLQKSTASGLELQAKILLVLQQLGLKLTTEQQQILQLASLIYPLPVAVQDEQTVPLLPQTPAPQTIAASEAKQGETPSITIKKAWEEFIAFKELLPKTKQSYESVFKIITGNRDYILTAERIEKDLKHFRMSYAKKKNFSATSINTYLTQIQVFLNWCTAFEYLPKINAKKKYGARKEKTDVKIFTGDELKLIFRDLHTHNYWLMLLCEFMYETGARPVDALTLHPKQCTGSTVKWRNKITKQEEERPITTRARQIVGEALTRSESRDQVFPWRHSSMSRLTMHFNDCLERCGIEKQGRSLKHFRTTFKHRIRELPFEAQSYLMRHHNANVTLGNYSYFDNKQIGGELLALEAAEKSGNSKEQASFAI